MEEARAWLRALCPWTFDMTTPNQERHGVSLIPFLVIAVVDVVTETITHKKEDSEVLREDFMCDQILFLKAKGAEESLQHGDSPRQNQRFENKTKSM
ncbi:hypothetical protein HispidOSU_018895, partial [Sigmodon hispidus]